MILKTEKTNELINLNLPQKFIIDFIEYWENIKRIMKPEGKLISWRKWNSIAKKMLKPLTIPFYNKWEHLETISWIKAYIKSFASITMHFKGAVILLPKQLIFYEAIKSNNTLFSSLKENPTNQTLERILISLFEDLNIRLIKSDLQIIQKLANPGFSKSLDRYPKLKELAYIIRRDVRTVSSRLDFLFLHQILSPIYLVDFARIGYQTELIYHKKEKSQIPRYIERYIAMFFPLTVKKFLTIIHYPFHDTKTYKTIIEFFNPNEIAIMENQYCGWNFSGLTQNPKDRWNLLPPILQNGGNWRKKLIIGETGIEFNLDPYYDPFPLTHRQAQLLGLIHKLSTMEEEYLAKQLEIGRAYITADMKKLLRNQIIFRFPIFSNLGLGSWIYFYIREQSQIADLLNIVEHMKFFPYVNLYYNQNTVVGRLNIPHSWTNYFIYSLTTLPKTLLECSSYYYIGPDSFAPWSFDILGTFDWDKYPK